MDLILVLLAILGLAVLAGLAGGAAKSRRHAGKLRTRVLSQPAPRDVSADLPARVRDFALRAEAHPADLARSVGFTQEAEMQLAPDADWQALSAMQWVATGAPAFVWQAEQDVGFLPKVRVTDAYLPGAAELDVRLLGAVRVAHDAGDAVARGEAMRYLAELPWVPDAILGNPALRWREIDADWVEVATEAVGGPVAVRFRLDPAGDIVEMRASGRPARDGAGQTVLRDWQGHFRDYAQVGPRRIPAEAEVGYVTDGRYRAYFRGRIVTYEATH